MVTLRKVSVNDAALVLKWKQDPYMIEMALDHGYQTSLAEQRLDIEQTQKSPNADYRIIVLNGTPIGYIRIDWINKQHTVAWLRFALGEERGKGYAKQALSQYIGELFQAGCIRIEGEVYEFNVPSQKVLEQLHFTQEGIKRKAHFDGTEYKDVLVYGLLQEDW